jgi:hypothetical protein
MLEKFLATIDPGQACTMGGRALDKYLMQASNRYWVRAN